MLGTMICVVLLSTFLLIGCGESDPDQVGPQDLSNHESSKRSAYVLQPDEGEVLFGGPRGGKVTIKVDPEKTGRDSGSVDCDAG